MAYYSVLSQIWNRLKLLIWSSLELGKVVSAVCWNKVLNAPGSDRSARHHCLWGGLAWEQIQVMVVSVWSVVAFLVTPILHPAFSLSFLLVFLYWSKLRIGLSYLKKWAGKWCMKRNLCSRKILNWKHISQLSPLFLIICLFPSSAPTDGSAGDQQKLVKAFSSPSLRHTLVRISLHRSRTYVPFFCMKLMDIRKVSNEIQFEFK